MAAGPGIFSLNSQGTGAGAILIANTTDLAQLAGSVPGRTSRPAKHVIELGARQTVGGRVLQAQVGARLPELARSSGGIAATRPGFTLKQSADVRQFRDALGQFATGVAIIAARAGADVQAMTANAVSSVSLEPMLLLFCPAKKSRVARLLEPGLACSVNFLRAGQSDPIDVGKCVFNALVAW